MWQILWKKIILVVIRLSSSYVPHQPWQCSPKCLFYRKSNKCRSLPALIKAQTSFGVEKMSNMGLQNSDSLNTVCMFPFLHYSFQCLQKLRANPSVWGPFASFSGWKIHLFCSSKVLLVWWKRWLWSPLKSTSVIMCADYACLDKQF